MFDLAEQIAQNLESHEKAAKNKNISIDFKHILLLSEMRKAKIRDLNSAQEERNTLSESLSKSTGQVSKESLEKGRALKEFIRDLGLEISQIENDLMDLLYLVPNLHSDDTPIGKDERENVEIKRFGEPKVFDFDPKDHIELGKNLDLIDLERGVKVHGFRGYFLKNEAATMHMAVLFLALEKMLKYGYTPLITPSIVKEFALFNTGHFPTSREDVFQIANAGKMENGEEIKDKMYLSGTAEIPLVSLHSGETLKESELPKKYVGFSPCYRSEIGSYGKDTKGVYRVHEFMKTEQVVICKADLEEAEKIHQEMMQISHEILEDLGLPHRYLSICTGDMGLGKYKMFDIETWMPSRNAYSETHSASNLTDWQSRRANIKYIDEKTGEKKYVYMLNNTALASPRILIAILENYQNKDGTITVPEVLRKWVGKDLITN